MTARTSPIAPPISAGVTVSRIVSPASSAINHTLTAVAPANRTAIASALVRFFPPEPGRASKSPSFMRDRQLWDHERAPHLAAPPR